MRKVGLLVVPGMGERDRGRTAEALMAGLAAALADGGREVHIERDDEGNPVSLEVPSAERIVNLYQVHWADVLAKDSDEGAFDVDMVPPLAWFPLLNWRTALTRGGFRAAAGTVAWTLLMLPPALLLWAGYGLVLLLRRLGERLMRRTPSRPAGLVAGSPRRRLDHALDRALGDVFTYVNSSGGAYRRSSRLSGAADEILGRFYRRLREAVDDECDEIQVLAHGLGSLVVAHALSGYRLEPGDRTEATFDPVARLAAIHTVASPLDKLRYVWPRLVITRLLGPIDDGDEGLPRRVDEVPDPPPFSWTNYWSPFDPLAGRLDGVQLWGRVENRVIFEGGPPGSHLVYERNRSFLGGLTGALLGEELAPDRRILRSALGVVRSLGAALRAAVPPLAVVAVTALLLAAVVLGLPRLGATALDAIGLDGLGDGVVDWGPLVVLVGATLGALIGSYRRSVEAHRRVWVTPPPSRTLPAVRRRV